MLFSISKQTFPKNTRPTNANYEVISGAVTPKDKTKSQTPLARLKLRIFSKSVISFLSFPVS